MAKPKLQPPKPYPGFPLTPHPNGQWCKKILGKIHFFGAWADPMAALGDYNRQAADLHAGREPREMDAHGTSTINRGKRCHDDLCVRLSDPRRSSHARSLRTPLMMSRK